MRRWFFVSVFVCLFISSLLFSQAPPRQGTEPTKLSPLGGKIAQMSFPPLTWNIPKVGKEIIREKLQNGVVLCLYPDPTIPATSIRVVFLGGSVYEVPEEDRLSSMLGPFMELGGTQVLAYEQLTAELEGMSASINVGIGDETGAVGARCLKEHFPRVMELVHDVLLTPGFREDKLELVKKQEKDNILRQKDYPFWIISTLFSSALFGDHPYGRIARVSRIDAVTKQDIVNAYSRYVVPERTFIAIGGDIDPKSATQLVKKWFGAWKPSKKSLPAYQKVQETFKPGYYYFEKDIPQTNVRVGHLGTKRGNPDEYALTVMNAILGGEAFKSRLDTRVRSDEGLAYSVGSYFGTDSLEPSSFTCFAETKNEKAFRTVTIMKDTIQEMRDKPPTAEEMKQAKETIVNSFIHQWTNTRYALAQIMNLEVLNEPKDYYETYASRIQAVTADDVLRVGKKYLHPDKLVVVLVGKRSEMKDLPGDIDLKTLTLPPEYLK